MSDTAAAFIRLRPLGLTEQAEARALLVASELGFVRIDRDATPPAIRATAQFASLCPASAHVMRRALGTA